MNMICYYAMRVLFLDQGPEWTEWTEPKELATSPLIGVMEDISGYRSINGNWYTFIHWQQAEEKRRFDAWKCEDCDDCLKDPKKWVKHIQKKHTKKRYAFTFTTNLDSKLEVQKEMCYSAWKLFLQNTTPVEVGEVYLEYTEEGRPHLHGWYECRDGGRIFAKTFRRCWPTWGEKARQTRFAGGYHEEIKTERYQGYASEEGRLIIKKEKNTTATYAEETASKWHI